MTPPLISRLEASRSYGLLLGLILVTLTFQASAPDERWGRLTNVVLEAGILLLALWTSRTKESEIERTALLLAAGLGVSGVLASSDDPRVGKGGLFIVGTLVVLVVPVIVGRGVFRGIVERRSVTLESAFGVLCVYLLLGALFSYVFAVVAAIQAGPLFTNGTDGTLQDHLYFSFITLTTVGYGDLSPAGDLARALSILEALVGQLYLVTVVAVIVANLGPRGRQG